MQLTQVISSFENFWPESSAEDWDRVGLVSGEPTQEISKILLSVDLTHAVIEEAIEKQVDLIITHHPVLLRPIDSLAETELKGALLSRVIKAGIAVFSAHTNADVQADGSSSRLAQAFGLSNLAPLVETDSGFGHGCIGELNGEITLGEFAERVVKAIPKTARGVAIAGDSTRKIATVAVCGGAGDGFLSDAISSDADVYVTSDLRHHPALDALETPRRKPLALIDISHSAAESLWLESAANRLTHIGEFDIEVSSVITDVWNEVIF